MNYYNDNDPFVVAWLRNLMAAKQIPSGEVDPRDIQEIRGPWINYYKQAHFFAGIAGWPLALKLAGWPEDRPVWTGSCPCQPFSVAGKKKGTRDRRHLWPVWYELIKTCKPPTIFGEQVASPDGREWLTGVRADLEALGYEVGAADLCAAGVGAPHIRQRLFWVAESNQGERGRLANSERCNLNRQTSGRQQSNSELEPGSAVGRMAHHHHQGLGIVGREGLPTDQDPSLGNHADGCGKDGGVGDPGSAGSRGNTGSFLGQEAGCGSGRETVGGESHQPESPNFWADSVWLQCLDGKARRVEPTIFPLAHGVPNRVGTLRGAGNAIVPPLAAEFVKAYLECGGAHRP